MSFTVINSAENWPSLAVPGKDLSEELRLREFLFLMLGDSGSLLGLLAVGPSEVKRWMFCSQFSVSCNKWNIQILHVDKQYYQPWK